MSQWDTMRSSWILLAVLLFLCTRLQTARGIGSGATTEAEEVNPEDPECSQPWPCTTGNPFNGSYSLSLSAAEYNPGQTINVMVHMTSCPTVDSPGPNWYKLEAISQVMLTPVGTFLEPPWRYEARLCQNKDMLIFSTCESQPLDLPRKYSWTAPTANVGIICFRLTIQTSGETNCSQAEACIQPAAVEVASGDMGGIELSGDDGNDDEDGEFHGEDYLYAAHTTSSSTHTQMCWRFREVLDVYNISMYMWRPRCNCQGSYKLVQCAKADDLSPAECWCTSSHSGSSIVGTRKQLQCSDPATMDFSSLCANIG